MNQKLDRFHRYLGNYEKLVKSFAAKYVGGYLAEDVAQEAFFALYQRMDYLDDAKVKEWSLTVTANIAKDCLRKGGDVEIFSMSPRDIREHIEEEEMLISLEELFLEREKKEAAREFCRAALELLYQKNPNWYYVVVDSYLLDMSSKQIAGVLKISVSHVDVIKHRAKAYLRRKLGDQYQEFF